VVLHAWVSATRVGECRVSATRVGPGGRAGLGGSGRWTRWQWVAPADEISIVPTRRADSAGAASSMIESNSISVVSDAARGDKTSA
jgi:hypothetical protein